MCQLHYIIIRCCFFILAFLLSAQICFAQKSQPFANEYYIQHYGESDGLIQNSIDCILPDKNDFLWIGTPAGVTRFNGNHFFFGATQRKHF